MLGVAHNSEVDMLGVRGTSFRGVVQPRQLWGSFAIPIFGAQHATMYTPARISTRLPHVTGSIRTYRARTEDAKLFRTMASESSTLPALGCGVWILEVRVKGLGLRVWG